MKRSSVLPFLVVLQICNAVYPNNLSPILLVFGLHCLSQLTQCKPFSLHTFTNLLNFTDKYSTREKSGSNLTFCIVIVVFHIPFFASVPDWGITETFSSPHNENSNLIQYRLNCLIFFWLLYRFKMSNYFWNLIAGCPHSWCTFLWCGWHSRSNYKCEISSYVNLILVNAFIYIHVFYWTWHLFPHQNLPYVCFMYMCWLSELFFSCHTCYHLRKLLLLLFLLLVSRTRMELLFMMEKGSSVLLVFGGESWQ